MIVHTAEKEQIKYFAQNQSGKITVFYVQTAVNNKHEIMRKNLKNLEVNLKQDLKRKAV